VIKIQFYPCPFQNWKRTTPGTEASSTPCQTRQPEPTNPKPAKPGDQQLQLKPTIAMSLPPPGVVGRGSR